MRLRLKPGVIEQIKRERNSPSDTQIAVMLRVSVEDVEAMRHGAAVSPEMALLVASIQGSGFDLSEWVETIPARDAIPA